MKLDVQSIEALFSALGERESDMRHLDLVISQTVPHLKRELFTGMNITMIAYGIFHYKYASGREGDWPIIALAANKNYISLYVCCVMDGTYVAEIYKDKLGKVSIGKSCIRFKKLADLQLDGVKEMLTAVSDYQKSGAVVFGI